jgi:hypothetical protein
MAARLNSWIAACSQTSPKTRIMIAPIGKRITIVAAMIGPCAISKVVIGSTYVTAEPELSDLDEPLDDEDPVKVDTADE